MIYINHRTNTKALLASVPALNGIEVDVRYHEDELVLCHDPFNHHLEKPETLESLLAIWSGEGPIILNLKTEGVEMRCIELMRAYSVKHWFFLDMSMPYFVRFADHAVAQDIEDFGPEHLAVRYSEKEPIEYALSFQGKVAWVWVDCFTHLPTENNSLVRLQKAGFKLCLVSPELQKHPLEMIATFQSQLGGFEVDAVCTKSPALWGQHGK